MARPIPARRPWLSSAAVRISGSAAIPLLLAGTVWVARYWRSARFGLYEDDLTIIPRAMQMSLPELGRFVYDYVVHLYGHARPLSDSLIYIFSFLGWRLGGLWGAYWIGYAIVALNALLFYFLLRRLHHGSGFAVLGGLSYALASADTTQAFLTHSLGLQPSLTLLLLAFHVYASRSRWLAYLLAALILFAYESPFPVFLAAPLLLDEWDRRLPRRLLGHAVLVVGILGAAAWVKAAAGEERVTELGLGAAIATSANHMLLGPLVSLATNALRPVEALSHLNLGVFLAMLACGGIFAFVLLKQDFGASSSLAGLVVWLRHRSRRTPLPAGGNPPPARPTLGALPRTYQLAIAGLVLLILAYPLTFTTQGYHIRGRPTRVHLAGGVGMSIFLASAGSALVQSQSTPARRRLSLLALSAWLGSMAGYGLVLQQDYVQAWDLQKSFWHELLPAVRDVQDGTVVLVDPQGLKDTWQIAANTWNLPRVLDQLYVFPSSWEQPPSVYRLAPGWEQGIAGSGGRLALDASTTVAPPSSYRQVDSSEVVLIETGSGILMRRTVPLVVDGQSMALQPQGPDTLATLRKGFLYGLMFGFAGGGRVNPPAPIPNWASRALAGPRP